MQWCIISESLYHSFHSKGNHGYGGIWGGDPATFHHNLLIHHSSRNPRFCGARYHISTFGTEVVDYRNNVIYNWGGNSAYGGEYGKHNLINNYYKFGPATLSNKKTRIINPSDTAIVKGPISKWYMDGNYVYGSTTVTADNWNGGFQPENISILLDSFKLTSPLAVNPVVTETAQDAFTSVLAGAGASLKRDTVDKRLANEALTGTVHFGGVYGAMKGIIDSPTTVGGWPVLNSETTAPDTDHDGMPDYWEIANSLDPNNASDRNGDTDGDGYTNLEEYLNAIVDGLASPSAVRIKQSIASVDIYPNPAREKANISFGIAVRSNVSVMITDISGKPVKTLINAPFSSGKHQIEWDVTNSTGKRLSSGVYFCKIKINKDVICKKIVVK